MAKKIKCLVRTRIKGLSEEDAKKFALGKIVEVDPDGVHGGLIRPGVLEAVETGTASDVAEDDGKGEGGEQAGAKKSQRGAKLSGDGKGEGGE